MKNEIGSGIQLMERDGVDAVRGKRNCSEGSCGDAAITSVDLQALCLNHFLLHCYERLEDLDPRGRQFSDEPVDVMSRRAFIEECSRKVLDVSLQSESPSNLSADDCWIFSSGRANCSCCCESLSPSPNPWSLFQIFTMKLGVAPFLLRSRVQHSN